ncbi:PREDICTED: uncharacterized protein LOC103322954 [Prunus mume]|uniref:Uncharacterized protein LOC103322954 n=1 Tax=Prunus mume TaxID=102107 RepID=A0ABM0NDD4_PRUMU|nr:PREDICTED: uncharacterized protein LOC103322954 [Prunus mume]
MAEFTHESTESQEEEELQEEVLDFAPAALDDSLPEVEDPLQEINLGTGEDPRPTFISALLKEPLKKELVALLQEFKDCFAWHYHEMPGLDRNLVEHKLPIKEGYLPVKQARRRMSMDTELKVKEEIERLLKAGFIRPAIYADWLANIVPVLKRKTGAVRICVDYRNLNEASPKDEYPMPMADMLVDGAAHNQMLSFMDGNAGYNQIMMAEEDIHKTAFMCPGHIGAFEYTVMPFGLRNAGATYQRAMNSVFHDMIGHSLEVYIDDVVIKSPEEGNHMTNLKRAFLRMRQHKLKMNPKKCVFGVQAGNFLGFLVHQRGIEIDKNKARSIIEALPPRNKKELQSLLGKINFLRRFISNSAGKIQPFSSLLRLKQEQTFKWEEQHQQAFEEIKHYLSNPPVLSPPRRGRPLKLYISASEVSIGSLLVQDNKEGKEQAVYYLSRTLTEVERKYSAIERLCLALYFTAVKPRHYMLPYTIYIIAKTDLIKYMLTRPMLRGRIGKWTLALTEFAFRYVPQKAVKGQAVADFLADHPGEEIENMDSLDIANADLLTRAHTCLNNPIYSVHLAPWKLYFDGSKTDITSGAGIVLEEPLGIRHCYSFQLDFQCTNNRAEYEALIIGLEILVELGIQSVEILGDSMLVLKQIAGEYKCLSPSLAVYLVAARNLLTEFREATWEHIPREEKFAANELAQVATGVQMPQDCVQRIIRIGKKSLPSVLARGMEIDVNSATITEDDWRNPIMTYLRYPTLPSEKRVRIMALNYLMWNEDLVRKRKDEVLLRCLGKEEYMKVMGETHEGICGAHQGGRKMCWLIRRYGYFWPTMMKDCINYSKGCESCQRHGPVQQAPSVPMNPVVKPWPLRGWAMDLIGKIYPASSQQHCFIIVATDYFTKWVEAKAVKSTTSQEIITFIEEQIIQRFGIPESITTDRGSSFISGEMLDMAEAFKIRLLQSTPYYAQANGQAESSNKVIINIIRKMLEKNPKQWHEKLSETLWAYRTKKREATGMTPYALTYGHDAILPMEIAVQSLRIAHQHDLVGENYSQAMLLELEGLDAGRIDTLNKLLAGKQAVSRAYNKRVRNKSFEEGEIVCKAVLPLGTHVASYGKCNEEWVA